MLVVDTSVWIDFLNTFPSWQARYLEKAVRNDYKIIVLGIVTTEILCGIKNKKEADKISNLLEPYSEDNYIMNQDFVEAATIYRTCRSKGLTIRSVIDCLIAQFCIRTKCALLAKDKDYAVISEFFSLNLITNKHPKR